MLNPLGVIGILFFSICLIFITIKVGEEKLKQGVGKAIIFAALACLMVSFGSFLSGEKMGRGNPIPFSNLEQNKLYRVVGFVPEHKLLLIKNDKEKDTKYIVDPPKEFQPGTNFLIKDGVIMVKN